MFEAIDIKAFLNEPLKLIIASCSVSLVLARIPFVGVFFRSLNTMVHESGHAIVALLSSGEVVGVDLKSDTSGSATTKSKSGIGSFFISISGYPFASATAFLLLYLLKEKQFDFTLYFLLLLALLNLLFWVRNLYGVTWLLIFSGLITSVFYFKNEMVILTTAYLLTSLLLIESVTSAAVVFYQSITNSKSSGDAKNLKDLTFIPAFAWGFIFLLQSVYFVYLGFKTFLY